jgi:hypothetical protein
VRGLRAEGDERVERGRHHRAATTYVAKEEGRAAGRPSATYMRGFNGEGYERVEGDRHHPAPAGITEEEGKETSGEATTARQASR